MPKLILGAFGLLAISWIAFMLHYVLVGSKRQPYADPPPVRRNPPNPPDTSPRGPG